MGTLEDAILAATEDVRRERAAVAPAVDPVALALAAEIEAKAKQDAIDQSWAEAALAAKGRATKPDVGAGWDEAVRLVNAEHKSKRRV